jgi:hypothetical protein
MSAVRSDPGPSPRNASEGGLRVPLLVNVDPTGLERVCRDDEVPAAERGETDMFPATRVELVRAVPRAYTCLGPPMVGLSRLCRYVGLSMPGACSAPPGSHPTSGRATARGAACVQAGTVSYVAAGRWLRPIVTGLVRHDRDGSVPLPPRRPTGRIPQREACP